ncbi:hypothetical protein QM565_03465 [Geitlerinema splendidum]|nr:hypothetical protein [Geitlerinema splendidum]
MELDRSQTQTARWNIDGVLGFLTRRRGSQRSDTSDILTYAYLLIGTLVMFVPVLWLVMSSFKPLDTLYETEQTFLPYDIAAFRSQAMPIPCRCMRSLRKMAACANWSQLSASARSSP